ncbi:MAG: IclR family transcriptional regulator [Anaerolineae bacterium]
MASLVPAIDRAAKVLFLLQEGTQQEYGVSEISRRLQLNKSTVHNILNTLAHHKLLVQNTATRRYRLGPALAELGNVVRSQIDLRSVARPHLRQLMERTGSTILLGIFDGAAITIVDKEEPITEVRVAASVGMTLPFCAGAFGKAFLAYLPLSLVDRLLADPGLKAFTPTSITNPDEFRAALATVRAQGYAVDDNQEYLLDVGAIAAPVFGPPLDAGRAAGGVTENVVAVITLVNFNSRLSAGKISQFIPWMLEAGREVSGRLGAPRS